MLAIDWRLVTLTTSQTTSWHPPLLGWGKPLIKKHYMFLIWPSQQRAFPKKILLIPSLLPTFSCRMQMDDANQLLDFEFNFIAQMSEWCHDVIPVNKHWDIWDFKTYPIKLAIAGSWFQSIFVWAGNPNRNVRGWAETSNCNHNQWSENSHPGHPIKSNHIQKFKKILSKLINKTLNLVN